LLILALALSVKQSGHEHAYALPSLESLEESSPNRPDATTREDKKEPIDPMIFEDKVVQNRNNKQHLGTIVDPGHCHKKCSGNGDCVAVFKTSRPHDEDFKNTDIIYVCECHENYIGNV
jgi:hypothetical protein